uniref:Uncharacterized protein n=1 Tax=Anguilla anguilla TaxID=7936 RepID=A0A0E9SUM8_ANGAN
MAGINEDYRSPVPCWKEVAWQHHGVNVQDFLNTVFLCVVKPYSGFSRYRSRYLSHQGHQPGLCLPFSQRMCNILYKTPRFS